MWGADITPEDTPFEAGLGFAVKLDKGDFVGREALAAPASPSACSGASTLDDPRAIALGSEPVRVGDDLVGRVTSGGYGYTVGSRSRTRTCPPSTGSAPRSRSRSSASGSRAWSPRSRSSTRGASGSAHERRSRRRSSASGRAAAARFEVLGGGITNHNLKVEVDGETLVLRVAGKDTDLLGIDRAVELAATEAAAALGIGPEVVEFVEPEGWLVTRFIEGEIPPLERMREPDDARASRAALRAFHGGPGDSRDVRLVPRRRGLPRDALDARWGDPGAYEWAHEIAGGSRRSAPATTPVPVPQRPPERELPRRRRAAAHRRLGVRGHGRPLLRPRELLDQPRARRAEARRCSRRTSGSVRDDDVEALELMRFMSDFREAMWGVVQSAVSELDFDFDAYAAEHFERLERTAESPAFLAALGEA